MFHDDLGLPIYVVFRNPADFPGKVVVRVQFAGPHGVRSAMFPTAVVDTIEEARSHIPPGRILFPAQPLDDPVIVESWL